MQRNDHESLTYLLSRADELCARAARGNFVHTNFLTPREQRYLTEHLIHSTQDFRAVFYGGYSGAERRCLLLFPDYALEALDAHRAEEADVAELLTVVGEDDPVSALSIRGSGYRTLTHRDYLGSLLSLGLEREVLGDIAIDNNDAIVLCRAHMTEFLLSSVERIGHDTVRISKTTLAPDFDGGRKFRPITDTVASPRLDCVVAALANLSREAAQSAIREGLVEWNYEIEQRPDHTVQAPCILSVRGVGKFALRQLGQPTKKGRIRLIADQYI